MMRRTTWLHDFGVLLSSVVLQGTRLVGAVVAGYLVLLYGLELLPDVIRNLEDTAGADGALTILVIGICAGSVGVTCAVWKGLSFRSIARYLSSGTAPPTRISPRPRLSEIPPGVLLLAAMCLSAVGVGFVVRAPPALDWALSVVVGSAAVALIVTVTRWLSEHQRRHALGLFDSTEEPRR